MKAYIVGEDEGIYTLVAEDGEAMCSHYCSSPHFAYGDLYGDRPERKKMFDDKGITEVVYLKNAPEMTHDKLVEFNKAWNVKHPPEEHLHGH